MTIRHFVTYNNTVPITLGVLFLGAGSAFAMSPEIRDAVSSSVYDAQTQVVAIDNTYIASRDLLTYTPTVVIANVTEDDSYYYVEYTLSTIALVNHIWQDTTQTRTMSVSKTTLGEYKDLGLYVTEQLGQLLDRELVYLKEVQEIEKRNVSQKTVATAYSGLVGALLTDEVETLPGYTPVVTPEPAANDVDPVAIAKNTNTQSSGSSAGGEVSEQATPITLQVIGANPARIPRNATYSDLGAVVTEEGRVVGYSITTLVDGVETNTISLDTTEDRVYTITYTAQNGNGDTGSVDRIIVIGDAEFDESTITADNTIPVTPNSNPDDDSDTDTPTTDTETSTTISDQENSSGTDNSTIEEETTSDNDTIESTTEEDSTTTETSTTDGETESGTTTDAPEEDTTSTTNETTEQPQESGGNATTTSETTDTSEVRGAATTTPEAIEEGSDTTATTTPSEV